MTLPDYPAARPAPSTETDAPALAPPAAVAQLAGVTALLPIRCIDSVQRLFADLADQPREVVAFAYLDPDWRLLGMRHGPGDAATAQVPIRAVARDTVAFGAARVVMAHNHPSGDPTPSHADLAATRRLATALAALGAPLVEHLVLARGGCFSLRGAGLI